MFQNQDFFFQIDSHCLFVKDWDEKLIHMVHQAEKRHAKEKVILSHYPPEYKDYKPNPSRDDYVTHIVKCFFDDQGIITFEGAVFKKPGPVPRRNAFIATGFIFARASLLHEVP